MQGFKKFLLQGNVVELAVAVVIATAFGKVVEAFVKFILDIIALAGGAKNFDNLSLNVGKGELYYGPIITTAIAFVILAAVVYFFVVKPYEAANARFKKDEEDAVETDESVELLKEIRDVLRARG